MSCKRILYRAREDVANALVRFVPSTRPRTGFAAAAALDGLPDSRPGLDHIRRLSLARTRHGSIDIVSQHQPLQARRLPTRMARPTRQVDGPSPLSHHRRHDHRPLRCRSLTATATTRSWYPAGCFQWWLFGFQQPALDYPSLVVPCRANVGKRRARKCNAPDGSDTRSLPRHDSMRMQSLQRARSMHGSIVSAALALKGRRWKPVAHLRFHDP